MRKILFAWLMVCITAFTLTACHDDEPVNVNEINKQTLLVFMPWSGSNGESGLYRIFKQNLDSIESAIVKAKGMHGRVLVFISSSTTESELFEISYEAGKTLRTPIKTYQGNIYTTQEGITQILNDVKTSAYALNYAMLIGCHGTGWTYKGDWQNYPFQAKKHYFDSGIAMAKSGHNDFSPLSGNYPTTRFYGSVTDDAFTTDISTLAAGIQGADMKMQFILFDDCYMSNVETAYELRNVTNYLLGSTSEIMALGIPYQTVWNNLASGTPNYDNAVKAFHAFYSKYDYPYGAFSAIDCREVERLAVLMKEINSRYKFDELYRDSVQVLDGFDVPIFYDLGNYADRLCQNKTLRDDFQAQLNNVVKYKSNTETLYSFLYYSPKYIKVQKYSGITISDLSLNPVALKGKEKTAWWKATH